MFYLGASLITKALKASSQWKLVPGRRKQIRKLDGKTPIGRLQNTAWNILRIQKFMWFGLNLLQEHLCYYVIYVITGYQRDLIKIRADHATSLHCDIFTSITNKHTIAVIKYCRKPNCVCGLDQYESTRNSSFVFAYLKLRVLLLVQTMIGFGNREVAWSARTPLITGYVLVHA